MVNMVSKWCLSSNNRIDLNSLLIVFSKNIKGFSDFHFFVIKCNRVLLDPQLIAFSMLVDSLLNNKLLNLTVFFDYIVPDNIAASFLDPGVSPCSHVFSVTMN